MRHRQVLLLTAFVATFSLLLLGLSILRRALFKAAGPTRTPPRLELLKPACRGPFLILHFRNDSSEIIDKPATIAKARIMVDGKVRTTGGRLVWIGPGDLRPGDRYDWRIDPESRFGVRLGPGAHAVAVEFGKRWSNTLTVRCR